MKKYKGVNNNKMEFIYGLQFGSLCLHLAFEYFAINTSKILFACELQNLIFINVF